MGGVLWVRGGRLGKPHSEHSVTFLHLRDVGIGEEKRRGGGNYGGTFVAICVLIGADAS